MVQSTKRHWNNNVSWFGLFLILPIFSFCWRKVDPNYHPMQRIMHGIVASLDVLIRHLDMLNLSPLSIILYPIQSFHSQIRSNTHAWQLQPPQLIVCILIFTKWKTPETTSLTAFFNLNSNPCTIKFSNNSFRTLVLLPLKSYTPHQPLSCKGCVVMIHRVAIFSQIKALLCWKMKCED